MMSAFGGLSRFARSTLLPLCRDRFADPVHGGFHERLVASMSTEKLAQEIDRNTERMRDSDGTDHIPLSRSKRHAEASVFRPDHLLREARRQRALPDIDVPAVCVLDPDGDLFRYARTGGLATLSRGWACYHTELFELPFADGSVVGILGNAVGGPFAVLVAEQLFASGCTFLVSITSSGRIADLGSPPYVVLIDRALRDEGTSVHYLPPSRDDFVDAPNRPLVDRIEAEMRAAFPDGGGTAVYRGATWTTDAPYRETETAIADAAARGVLAVEMEAAALYAFSTARGFPVACFAHVTNTMGQHTGDDFEKGEAEGTVTALRLIQAATKAFSEQPT